MPRTADILARVPPSVREDLQNLIKELPSHIDEPSQSDMVGALILAARRTRQWQQSLPDALAAYYELKNAWKRAAK